MVRHPQFAALAAVALLVLTACTVAPSDLSLGPATLSMGADQSSGQIGGENRIGPVLVRVSLPVDYGAARSATVRVGTAAGVVVGPGLVATAQHVVGDLPATAVPLRFIDGVIGTGTTMWQDTTTDLALVRVALPPGTAIAPLRCDTPPRWAEPVAAIGHPYGLGYVITRGYIAAVSANGGKALLDILINPGNSGGGVWDADGRLIAIVTDETYRAELVPLMVPAGYGLARPVAPLCAQIDAMGATGGPR